MANVTVTTAANFIPDIWSNEVLAFYKKKTVMRGLVTVFDHNKKAGDSLQIPKFAFTGAAAKAADTAITPSDATHGIVSILLNKHFAKAVRLEDIVAVQAIASLRMQYTRLMGEALAREKDYFLHSLGTGLQSGTLDTTPGTSSANTVTYDGAFIGSDGTTAWDPTAATNTGNGASFTDAGIRRTIQRLQDADLDTIGASLIVPPVEYRKLSGVTRFTEQAFTGDMEEDNTIHNGIVGDIYGVKVYSTTLCPTTFATDTTTAYRACLLLHKDAFGLAEQLMPRIQEQYTVLDLATNVVADELYGGNVLRTEAGVAIIVPNS